MDAVDGARMTEDGRRKPGEARQGSVAHSSAGSSRSSLTV